jgi:putative acetyltransferase
VSTVRRERPADADAVAAVTTAAFERPGYEPVETPLLAALREDAGWIPALSLVAVEHGEVLGHVVCTRATCGGAPALGLGPIAVRPDRQRSGVGSALMHAVLGAAEALDERLVVLLGDPAFYRRFGFVTATEAGVQPPDPAWGEHFLARPLTDEHPRGPFRYAAPFEAL